jgi:hypothetical protein
MAFEISWWFRMLVRVFWSRGVEGAMVAMYVSNARAAARGQASQKACSSEQLVIPK